jgi:hypothetical protein
MNEFQMAVAVMAACDVGGSPRDAEGRRRQYTAAELDSLAEIRWPLAGAVHRLTVGANAMLARLRPRARNRFEPTMVPSVEATAQV